MKVRLCSAIVRLNEEAIEKDFAQNKELIKHYLTTRTVDDLIAASKNGFVTINASTGDDTTKYLELKVQKDKHFTLPQRL